MGFVFKVIGRNPPMAFIIGGVFLVALGLTMNNPLAVNIGGLCLLSGFVLQVLWLFTKRGRF